MPELVEVENYRSNLLSLISKSALIVECPSKNPPKTFLSKEDLDFIGKCYTNKIERKGKLIRLHLKQVCDETITGCLYLHMGMTGRISTPNYIPNLESLSKDDTYPPPHTHLILKVDEDGNEIAYSDPRKFGSICFNNNGPLEKQWNDIAIDALDTNASFDNFIGSKRVIKALLLDQRAVISGVGNWIADEVLYQCKVHPDQTYLTVTEVNLMKKKLNDILTVGIQCLDDNEHFPSDWIFQSRWMKKSKDILKDHNGYDIKFVKSGGRTSAIVPKFQKKVIRAKSIIKKQKSTKKMKKNVADTKDNTKKQSKRVEKRKANNDADADADDASSVVGRRQSKRLSKK